MISKIKFVFSVLNATQKKRFFWLFSFMVFSSFFEILNIVALIDFANFLSSHSSGKYFGFFEKVMSLLNINYIPDIQLRGFIVIIILILSTISSLMTIYLSARFSYFTGGELESKLFNYYLKRNYLFHLDTTSSKLLNNIFELVKRVTDFLLAATLLILSKLIFLIPLIVGLIIYKTKITLIVCFLFISLYFIFFKIFRKKLSYLGELQTNVTKEKFSVLQEGFGAIKEIKILDKYKFFQTKYRDIYSLYAQLMVKREMIGKLPKHFIEFFTFAACIFLITYLNRNFNYSFNQMVFNLSFFIICAYKIIPAFQQIYYHVAVIRYHIPALDAISSDFVEVKKIELKNNLIEIKNSKFSNFKLISVKDLNFNYKNSKIFAVKNLSFNINRGEKIGITGPSGSGKTTLIHILSGLIKQNSGQLRIDNEIIEQHNLKAWQGLLGFVPQATFITEKTIKENIAFGVNENDIDDKKLKKFINFSKLSETVDSLSEKENTKVGERGIKLSGGQQQRLGIARALYTNPKVIIFDEATNALDVLTENEILNSLDELGKDITIVMIAHRLEIMRRFDKIIFLNKGKLDGFGSFNELMQNNVNFKNLVEVNKLNG